MSPPSHRMWLEAREDETESLQAEFTQWLDTVSMNEKMFKAHVYDNPEATQFDFRQHRTRLYSLLFQGERLALRYEQLTDADVSAFINLLDLKLADLQHTLLEWHAPVDFVDNVPASFKQGVEDIDEGRVVDMERALTEQPK